MSLVHIPYAEPAAFRRYLVPAPSGPAAGPVVSAVDGERAWRRQVESEFGQLQTMDREFAGRSE